MVEREADELVAKYGTPRRTAIITDGALCRVRCAALPVLCSGWWLSLAAAQPHGAADQGLEGGQPGGLCPHISRSACTHPACPYPPPAGEVELRQEDVIPNTPSLVVYSRRGYIKRMRADAFDVQRLGGKGARRAGRAAGRACCPAEPGGWWSGVGAGGQAPWQRQLGGLRCVGTPARAAGAH